MSELLRSPATVINEAVEKFRRQQLYDEVVKEGGTIVFREGNNPPISVNYGDKYNPEEEERLKQVLLRQPSNPVLPFSFTYLGRGGREIWYYGVELIDDK